MDLKTMNRYTVMEENEKPMIPSAINIVSIL